jgi:hypothetical protein
MILYLKVKDEHVTAEKYHTVGCGRTLASGSTLTEMIVGQSIAECRGPGTPYLTRAGVADASPGMEGSSPVRKRAGGESQHDERAGVCINDDL